MTIDEEYAKSLRHAVEYVYVVAARRGLDTSKLAADIDHGREPGICQEHSLTISVRGTPLRVTAEGIPHDWITIGTGFIDTRYSQRIAFLLSELEKEWVR